MKIFNKTAPSDASASPGTIPGASLLSSWKDIASYLGKGVRTAQRWEKEFGLPVRRPKQSKKSAVFAVPAEINDWVRLQRLSEGQAYGETTEKADLLKHIQELEQQNSELQRQIEILCSKTA